MQKRKQFEHNTSLITVNDRCIFENKKEQMWAQLLISFYACFCKLHFTPNTFQRVHTPTEIWVYLVLLELQEAETLKNKLKMVNQIQLHNIFIKVMSFNNK